MVGASGLPSTMDRSPERHRMSRITARVGRATLAAGLLLLVTPVAGSAAAQTPTSAEPSRAAAGWLAEQLTDEGVIEVTFEDDTFPDMGLTADAVLAMSAAGVAGDAAATATDYLAAHVEDYASQGKDEYAGSYAKLLLLAAAQGRDPSSFGGVDLITALQEREKGSGRYGDKTVTGDDYTNVITQALAVLALQRATDDGPSPAAVQFLADQQCDDGGFPTSFVADGADTCASGVDATGFAAQALLAAGEEQPAQAALDWLEQQRGPDGGFQGEPVGDDQPVTNANSTALAVQALAAGGRDVAESLDFLTGLQLGCAAPPDRGGAIVFNDAALPTALDQQETLDVATTARATAQAVPALAGLGLAEITAAGAEAAAPELECTNGQPAATAGPAASAGASTAASPADTAAPAPDAAGDARAGASADGGAGTPMLLLAGGALLAAVAVGAALLLGRRRSRGA